MRVSYSFDIVHESFKMDHKKENDEIKKIQNNDKLIFDMLLCI